MFTEHNGIKLEISNRKIYDNTHKSIRERKAELIIIQYPEGGYKW